MKTIEIGIILLVLLAFMPITMAEETTELDQNEPVLIMENPELVGETKLSASDLAETNQMNNPMGARVRLMQLEKRITKNYLVGQQVILVIQKNHEETDTNELELLNEKLNALKSEVTLLTQKALPSGEAATEYVSIKKEAITITQEFRTITQTILTDEDKQEIAEKVKEIQSIALNDLDKKIKGMARSYNAQQINAFMKQAGLENNSFTEQIQTGQLTKTQIRERLMQHYTDLNEAMQQKIIKQTQQNTTRKNVAQKALIQYTQQKMQQKIETLREKIGTIKNIQSGNGSIRNGQNGKGGNQ